MSRRIAACAWAFSVLIAGACATAPPNRTPADCALMAADSEYLKAGPLYTRCSVEKTAVAIDTRINDLSSLPPATGADCLVAEVRLVVGVDGKPESDTPRLVRGTNGAFSDAVLASPPFWRYTPAIVSGKAVRELITERKVIAVATRTTRNGVETSRSEPRNCR